MVLETFQDTVPNYIHFPLSMGKFIRGRYIGCKNTFTIAEGMVL